MLDMENKTLLQKMEGKYPISKEEKRLVGEMLNKALQEAGKESLKVATATGTDFTTARSEFEPELLYRESRNLLKTSAKITGRSSKGDRSETKLIEVEEINSKKDVYTQRVAVLMSYLLKEWQTDTLNSRAYYVIKNFSKVARDLNTTPQRLKEDITKVGGYTYPYIKTIKRGKTHDTIDAEYKKMFEVKVRLRVDSGTIKKDGFINPEDKKELDKNSTVKEVLVKPCRELRESIGRDSKGREIKGKEVYEILGIGNVLTPVANILLSLSLGLWAYKLYCFIGSNRPSYQIVLDKLLGHLGVAQEDLAKQGKPRYKENIDKGLKELEDKGYLERWTYNKSKDMYYWKFTVKAFRHPELVKESKKDTIKV